jgi:hypothetical protein
MTKVFYKLEVVADRGNDGATHLSDRQVIQHIIVRSIARVAASVQEEGPGQLPGRFFCERPDNFITLSEDFFVCYTDPSQLPKNLRTRRELTQLAL